MKFDFNQRKESCLEFLKFRINSIPPFDFKDFSLQEVKAIAPWLRQQMQLVDLFLQIHECYNESQLLTVTEGLPFHMLEIKQSLNTLLTFNDDIQSFSDSDSSECESEIEPFLEITP